MKPLRPLKLAWVVLKIAVWHRRPLGALHLLQRRWHKYLLFKRFKVCKHCGKPGTLTNPLTIDHIHPLIRGGTNAFKNKQILCLRCNKRKGHKPDYMRATMSESLKAFIENMRR